ncbi:flagellar hook-length control protein FliK [Arthrobacter sp. MMS18-M83]|uniref:flagellar hook-length control protein FliK n=1 Tax=Arthrobacter sp. MMS18-M83 TaxID=2996261 RepID=UPI00227D67C9|nr:flagellar hook-length control protein FliK [Arthrobacter sp. MMS18-M83]WAH99079.1 flagellar hook-length control protein FliK [Arthrobacter sp. MMS18-M83]
MQLPPATAAPRLPSPGGASAPHSGSPTGFDAVMGGVLASGAAASGGKPSGVKDQPAPDDGGPGKPATDGSGTVALPGELRLGKPGSAEHEKTEDAKGTADPANAVDAAGACAPGGLAVSGIPSGNAAAQESVAGTLATTNVSAMTGGSASGGLSSATQPASLPVNATAPSGSDGVAIIAGNLPSLGSTLPSGNTAPSNTPTASTTAPSAPTALPAGNPGPNTVEPGAIHPGPVQPIAASAASPAPAGPEAAVSTTAALAGAAGTAVVLPSGKPATQQDPELLGGQGTPATAGIQAGIPAVLQPASALQQVPSAATAGVATPAPQADPAKLLPQVKGPLFSLAAGEPGRHVMTLRLSPEDLGPLTVRAHIDGAGVRIELFAPGEAGREAVRSILPELRRGLGESGFGASLDLSEHNAPADAGAGGSDARDRRPADRPAFPRGSDGEPARFPRTAVVLPRSSTSSLDILV